MTDASTDLTQYVMEGIRKETATGYFMALLQKLPRGRRTEETHEESVRRVDPRSRV
jgi:hypothetical protein